MKNYFYLIFTFVLAVSLQGCGSDDKSQAEDPQQAEDPPIKDALGNIISQDQTVPVTGKAIDGYLESAVVCIDADENGRCGPNDPKAITGVGGSYSINVPEPLVDKKPKILVFAVEGLTVDEDSPGNPIEKGYSMSALYGSKAVTPITTMVVETMEATGSSQSEAEQEVKQKLNLQLDSIDADYIALKEDTEKSQVAEVAHQKAKMLVEVFTTIRDGVDADGQANDDTDKAYNAYLKETGLITDILTEIGTILGDSDSAGETTDIEDKIQSLQTMLEKKVRNHLEMNKQVVEFARSQDDSFLGAEEKTQLLKGYMGSGYYYNPTDYNDSDDNAFYGYYGKLSLDQDKFNHTDMVYAGDEGWKSENVDDDKYDRYDSESGKFITIDESQGANFEFDDLGNLLFKDWSEIVSIDYKLDLAQKPLARIVAPEKDAKVPLSVIGKKFSDNAEAVSLKLRQIADDYNIHVWSGSGSEDETNKNYNRMYYWDGSSSSGVDIRSLDQLLQAFKFAGGVSEDKFYIEGHSTGIANNLMMQFHLGDNYQDGGQLPTSGKAYLYHYRQVVTSSGETTSLYQLPEQATWSREKLLKDDGQRSDAEIVRIELPEQYLGAHSENVFFIAQADDENNGQTIVRRGNVRTEGVASRELFLLNETAMNDIKDWVVDNDYTLERYEGHQNNSNGHDHDDDVFLNDLAIEVKNAAEKKQLAETYLSESATIWMRNDDQIMISELKGNPDEGYFTVSDKTYQGEGQWIDKKVGDEDNTTLHYQPSSGKFEVGPDACEVEGAQISYSINEDGTITYDGEHTLMKVEYEFDLSNVPLAWALFHQFEDNGEFYAPVELSDMVMPEDSKAIEVVNNCNNTNYYIENDPRSIVQPLGQDENVSSLLTKYSGQELSVHGLSLEFVYESGEETGEMYFIFRSGGRIVDSKQGSWRIETLNAEDGAAPAKILTFDIPESFRGYFHGPKDRTPFLVITDSTDSTGKVLRIGYKEENMVRDEEIMLYNSTAMEYIKNMIEKWAY